MFDDGIDFVVASAHDASITKGIREVRGEDRGRIAAVAVKMHEMLQAVAADKRDVTRQNQQISGESAKRLAGAQDRVPRPELFFLIDESCFREQGLDLFRLMPDDNKNPLPDGLCSTADLRGATA